MSEDWNCVCFEDGEAGRLPTALLESIFEPYIRDRDEWCITVQFDEESQSYVYYEIAEDHISDFTINRPCDHDNFYRCLYELMRQTNLMLLVPADCPPVVGRDETVAHMPLDFIEDTPPDIVHSAEEFISLLRSDRAP